MPRPPSTPDRRAALLRLASTAAAVAVVFLLVLLLVGHSAQDVRRAVDGFGAAGPLVFVALVAALTIAFFPFPVMAAASGVLFGTAGGTALSIIGGVLGAAAAFGIARRFGAGPVAALAPPRLQALIDAAGRRGFVAVLYLRILPGLPRDLVNYLCGLTAIRFAAFAGATLIGISPRAYAYTALGGSLGNLGSPEAIVAVSLLVGMGLLGLVLLARERRATRGPRGASPPG